MAWFVRALCLCLCLAMCAPQTLPAVSLDGEDDYLKASSGVSLAGQSFTLEIWVFRRRDETEETLFSVGSNTAYNGLWFGFLDDDRVQLSFWEGGSFRSLVCTNRETAFGAGHAGSVEVWNHYSATFEAGRAGTPHHLSAHIYRNGVPVAHCTKTSPFLGSGPLYIGRSFDGAAFASYLRGYVQEARVWQGRALDRSVIRSYMTLCGSVLTGSFHPYQSWLKAYWRLDEGTGATAANSAPLAAAGSSLDLINSPRWVTGLRFERVPVADVPRTLAMDTSQAHVRGSRYTDPTPERSLFEYYRDPSLTRRLRRRLRLRRLLSF